MSQKWGLLSLAAGPSWVPDDAPDLLSAVVLVLAVEASFRLAVLLLLTGGCTAGRSFVCG